MQRVEINVNKIIFIKSLWRKDQFITTTFPSLPIGSTFSSPLFTLSIIPSMEFSLRVSLFTILLITFLYATEVEEKEKNSFFSTFINNSCVSFHSNPLPTAEYLSESNDVKALGLLVHNADDGKAASSVSMILQFPVAKGALYLLDIIKQDSDYSLSSKPVLILPEEKMQDAVVCISSLHGIFVIDNLEKGMYFMGPDGAKKEMSFIGTLPVRHHVVKAFLNPGPNFYVMHNASWHEYHVRNFYFELDSDGKSTLKSKIIITGITDPEFFDAKFGHTIALRLTREESKDSLYRNVLFIDQRKSTKLFLNNIKHLRLYQSFDIKENNAKSRLYLQIVTKRPYAQSDCISFYNLEQLINETNNLPKTLLSSRVYALTDTTTQVENKNLKTTLVASGLNRCFNFPYEVIPTRRHGNPTFLIPQIKYPCAIFLKPCALLNSRLQSKVLFKDPILEILDSFLPLVINHFILRYIKSQFVVEQIVYPILMPMDADPLDHQLPAWFLNSEHWRMSIQMFPNITGYMFVMIIDMLSEKIVKDFKVPVGDVVGIMNKNRYFHYSCSTCRLSIWNIIGNSGDDETTEFAFVSDLKVNKKSKNILYIAGSEVLAVVTTDNKLRLYFTQIDKESKTKELRWINRHSTNAIFSNLPIQHQMFTAGPLLLLYREPLVLNLIDTSDMAQSKATAFYVHTEIKTITIDEKNHFVACYDRQRQRLLLTQSSNFISIDFFTPSSQEGENKRCQVKAFDSKHRFLQIKALLFLDDDTFFLTIDGLLWKVHVPSVEAEYLTKPKLWTFITDLRLDNDEFTGLIKWAHIKYFKTFDADSGSSDQEDIYLYIIYDVTSEVDEKGDYNIKEFLIRV